MKQYEYTPLLPEPNSIRLVQILPGEQDTIHCTIFNHTIKPQQVQGLFEALSYVWGDDNNKERICIVEQATSSCDVRTSYTDVTRNLYAALLGLRDSTLPRTIWIDALCINQADTTERASQVLSMVRIYMHASRVIVWLGEEIDANPGIFASSDLLQDDVKQSGQECTVVKNPTDDLSSIAELLTRPWFRRVWVLQEAGAARHITVMYGKNEMMGTVFGQRILHALETTEYHRELRSQVEPVIRLMLWHTNLVGRHASSSAIQQSGSISLEIASLGELLDRFHRHGTKDRRDKIYALLGMHRPTRDAGQSLRPNYTEEWPTVFRKAIRYVLGPALTIKTFPNQELAIIQGLGSTLGTVTEVGTTIVVQHHRHRVWRDAGDVLSKENIARGEPIWEATWTTPHWCKTVAPGDILCKMHGATSPSIIRFCRTHFDIVVISMPPPQIITVPCNCDIGLRWETLLGGSAGNSKSLTLVWDWSRTSDQVCSTHDQLFQESSLVETCDRLSNCAQIMDSFMMQPEIKDLLQHPGHELESNSSPPWRDHLALLNLAYDQGNMESYLWLRKLVEIVSWRAWLLEDKSHGLCTDVTCESEDFWASPRCHVKVDVLSLSSWIRPANWGGFASKSSSHHFDERKHQDFLAKLIRVSAPCPRSDHTSSTSKVNIINAFCVATKTRIRDLPAALSLANVSSTSDLNTFEVDLAVLLAASNRRTMLTLHTQDIVKIPHSTSIRIAALLIAESPRDSEPIHQILVKVASQGLVERNEKRWSDARSALRWLCLTQHALVASLLESEQFIRIACVKCPDSVLLAMHFEYQNAFETVAYDNLDALCDHSRHETCADLQSVQREVRLYHDYKEERTDRDTFVEQLRRSRD